MNKWRTQLYLVGLLILLFAGSCASKKHLSNTHDAEEWRALPADQLNDFLVKFGSHLDDTLVHAVFQSRGKAFLTMNGESSQEVNFQMRFKHREGIWISATSMLGMEAGRLYIRPDSLFVLNRMESTYQQVSFAELQDWIGLPISFEALQMLLIGRFSFEGNLATKNSLEQVKNQAQWNISTNPNGDYKMDWKEGGVFVFTPAFNLSAWQMTNVYQESLWVKHAYSTGSMGLNLPSKTSLSFQTPKIKLIGSLEYQRTDWPETVNFPFSIPKGYRQIH